MKRYGSMEKTVIYVSILAFIGVVVLIICLGMAAASDDSIVANVETKTETIGITLNTKNGLVLDTSLNNLTTLTSTNIDNVQNIREDIISANLPSVTEVQNGTFANCFSLKSITLENLTTISGGTTANGPFENCYKLKDVNMPKLQTISLDSCFRSCSSLENINLPSLETINGSNTFSSCSSLKKIHFPLLKTVGDANTPQNQTFSFCRCLENVNFPSLQVFNSHGAFHSCVSLKSFVVPTTSILKGDGNGSSAFFSNCSRLGEGISKITINITSSDITNSTGNSQGRTAAVFTPATGILQFN